MLGHVQQTATRFTTVEITYCGISGPAAHNQEWCCYTGLWYWCWGDCQEARISFIILVVESFGGWSKQATDVILLSIEKLRHVSVNERRKAFRRVGGGVYGVGWVVMSADGSENSGWDWGIDFKLLQENVMSSVVPWREPLTYNLGFWSLLSQGGQSLLY